MARRKGNLKPFEVPRCHELVQRGTERESCDRRATHRVEHWQYGRWWTNHACVGHLARVLRNADQATGWERQPHGKYGPMVESPSPKVYRLTHMLDTNAKAYGRTEVIEHAELLTGAIQPGLF
jgi:hypothetical protein